MEKTIKKAKLSGIALGFRLLVDTFAMVIIVGLFWFVRDIIRYCTTHLEITNKRITGKIGLIHTEELDSPLNKINSCKVTQGLFGKMFNYGTVAITTASSEFVFNFIKKPNEFKNILNNQIEAYDDERIEKQAKKLASAIKE